MKWHAEVVYVSGTVEAVWCPTRRKARAAAARLSADWRSVRSVSVRKAARR